MSLPIMPVWDRPASPDDRGDPPLFIESIPFKETRWHYVDSRKLRNYWMYQPATNRTTWTRWPQSVVAEIPRHARRDRRQDAAATLMTPTITPPPLPPEQRSAAVSHRRGRPRGTVGCCSSSPSSRRRPGPTRIGNAGLRASAAERLIHGSRPAPDDKRRWPPPRHAHRRKPAVTPIRIAVLTVSIPATPTTTRPATRWSNAFTGAGCHTCRAPTR
jgi:hypothetical protein